MTTASNKFNFIAGIILLFISGVAMRGFFSLEDASLFYTKVIPTMFIMMVGGILVGRSMKGND